MKSKTVQKTGDKLILVQQHKVHNITASVLLLAGLITFYIAFSAPINKSLFVLAFLQAATSLLFFYKGATYTFTIDKKLHTAERTIKGFFQFNKQKWDFEDIKIFIIAESFSYFQTAENCHHNLLMETSRGKRIRLFTYKSRPVCKKNTILLSQYFKKEKPAPQKISILSVPKPVAVPQPLTVN